MIEFASERTVRPARRADLPGLRATLTRGPQDKHEERFARQERGEAVYFVAVQENVPVGHALLKWEGNLTDVPDIEDLIVHEGHRRRGVATKLLAAAETEAASRGYNRIGLSCGVQNAIARELYEKRGYSDAGLGVRLLAGVWTDAEGHEHTWEEECIYLVCELAGIATVTGSVPGVSEGITGGSEREHQTMADEEAAEQQQGSVREESGGVVAAEPTASITDEEGGQKEQKPLADRVLDVAFGAALLAGEALEKVIKVASEKAKNLSENGPAVLQSVEEKGRPAREKFVRVVREGALQEPAPKGATADNAGAPKTQAAAKAVASAEEEIRLLEERVRALEQELSSEASATVPTAVADPVAYVIPEPETYIVPEPETMAEASTFVNDFTPETLPPSALADSPYAISETDEEVVAEATVAEVHSLEAVFDPEVPVEAVAEETTAPSQKRGRRTKAAKEEVAGDTDAAEESSSEGGGAAE